jgi:hypothetical protein
MIIHNKYKHEKKIIITERQSKFTIEIIKHLWNISSDRLGKEEAESIKNEINLIYAWLKTECPECGSDVIANKCTSPKCNQNDRS